MKKLLAVVFLGAVALWLSGGEVQAECYGEACGDLAIKKRGGCIILENRNQSNQIRVDGPNWIPSYVFYVYPNSEETPKTMQGNCISDWYEKWNATYKGGSTSGLPGGTYNKSCNDCAMQGSILRCRCDGKNTSLNLDSCSPSGRNLVCNNKGTLNCTGGC